MEVEIGIQNCPRPVTFTTDTGKDEVTKVINTAIENGTTTDLVDDKGRHILIPGKVIGYAIVGSETQRPVGFGNL